MPSLLRTPQHAISHRIGTLLALFVALALSWVLVQPADAIAAAPAAPAGCTTTTTTVSESPGEAIPNYDDEDGVYSTIEIPAGGSYIWDVDVTTNITHTGNGDLYLELYSPEGGMTLLSDHRGSTMDNVFNGVVWDDQSTSLVSDFAFVNNVTPPNLSPEGALGAFIGEDPEGEWELDVYDTTGSSTGTLVSWSLTITRCATEPPSDAVNGSNLTPITITDNGTITSDITIAGGGAAVCGIELSTGLRHTRSDQLDVTLRSPSMVTTVLSSDNGGAWANNLDGVLWSDYAEDLLTNVSFSDDEAPAAAAPEGALSALLGGAANGMWRLSVTDDAAGIVGTLTGWTLRVWTCEPPASPQPVPAVSNSSVPVITGTTNSGATLTGTSGTWMTLAYPLNLTSQWRRCDAAGASCVDIAGATDETYQLTQSDGGSTFRVVTTANNGSGPVAATSAQTAVVAPNVIPASTAIPAITGTAQDGLMLVASNGTWSGTTATYTRVWRRCDAAGSNCVDVPGRTEVNPTLNGSDVGRTLRMAVTATNLAGSATAVSNPTALVTPTTAASNLVLPTIAGTPKVGATLIAYDGTWSGVSITYSYRWQRCSAAGTGCVDNGATASTYAPVAAEFGSTMRVIVTATNSGGAASATSAATGAVASSAPVNTALPTITYTGTLSQSSVLRGSKGTWSTTSISYDYRWMRCDAAGNACVETSYAGTSHSVLTSDAGTTMRYRVTATKNGMSTTAISAPTALIPGSPVVVPPKDTTAPTLSFTMSKLGKLANHLKKGVVVKATANEGSTVKAELRLTPKLAKQLKLPVVVGVGQAKLSAAGTTTITIKFTAAAKKKLAKLPKVNLSMSIAATDTASNVTKRAKAIVIKK